MKRSVGVDLTRAGRVRSDRSEIRTLKTLRFEIAQIRRVRSAGTIDKAIQSMFKTWQKSIVVSARRVSAAAGPKIKTLTK